MTPLEIIKATRRRLEKPSSWIQRNSSRDKLGMSVAPKSLQAVCWCLGGALSSIVSDDVLEFNNPLEAREEVIKTIGDTIISTWNDACHRTHADVIEALDVTIDRLESHVSISSS